MAYHEHDAGAKGTASRAALVQRCKGTKTVPEVFLFGTWVGGWDKTDGGEKGAPGIEPLMENGLFEQAVAKKDASLCFPELYARERGSVAPPSDVFLSWETLWEGGS